MVIVIVVLALVVVAVIVIVIVGPNFVQYERILCLLGVQYYYRISTCKIASLLLFD